MSEPASNPGFFSAFSGLSAARALQYLFRLGTVKVSAHYLGPHGVGIVSQIQLLNSQVLTFSMLSMGNGVTKLVGERIAQEKSEQVRQVVGTALSILMVIMTLTLALTLFFADKLAGTLLDDARLVGYVRIALWAIPCTLLTKMITAVLQGMSRFRNMAVASSVSALGTFVVWVIWVSRWRVIGGVVAVPVMAALSLVAFYIVAWRDAQVRRVQPFGWPSFDKQAFLWLMKYTLVGLSSGLLSPFLILWGRSIVVHQVGLEQMGLYTPVLVMTGIIQELIRTPLQTYLLPVLAGTKDHAEIRKKINYTLRWTLLLTVAISCIFLTLRYYAIPLIYNSKFLPAAELLGPHLAGMVLGMVGGGCLGILYTALPRLRALVIVDAVGKLFHVALIFLLTRKWGLMGLSFSYLGFFGFGLAVSFLFFRQQIGFSFERSTLVTGLVGLGMIALLSWLRPVQGYQIVLSLAGIGGVGWALLGAQGRRDLGSLIRRKRRDSWLKERGETDVIP